MLQFILYQRYGICIVNYLFYNQQFKTKSVILINKVLILFHKRYVFIVYNLISKMLYLY